MTSQPFFFFLNNIYLIFQFSKYNIDNKKHNNITLNRVYNSRNFKCKEATTQEVIHNKANTKLKIK